MGKPWSAVKKCTETLVLWRYRRLYIEKLKCSNVATFFKSRRLRKKKIPSVLEIEWKVSGAIKIEDRQPSGSSRRRKRDKFEGGV